MAERSFKQEVKKLRLGAGEEFHGARDVSCEAQSEDATIKLFCLVEIGACKADLIDGAEV